MAQSTVQHAVVTGSTSGIGWGIARAFAARGFNVTLNGIADAGTVERLLVELQSEFKVKAWYSPANMMKPNEIRQMIVEAEGRSMFSSITPVFSTSLPSRNFQKKNGTRLSRSTCRVLFTRQRPHCPE